MKSALLIAATILVLTACEKVVTTISADIKFAENTQQVDDELDEVMESALA